MENSKVFTFNKKHGPTAEVFNCEDHVSSIGKYGISDGHLVLAAIVDNLDTAISDHNLAIDCPGWLIIEIMREETFKIAAFTLQNRGCLNTMNNGDL